MQSLNWVYGDAHPVAQVVARISAARTSAATQQAAMDRQRAIDVRLADAAVAAGVPDASQEMAESQRAEAQERVWALRNVAASLERGSREERGKARTYYETALALQRSRFRDFQHPGLVAELWGCAALFFSCTLRPSRVVRLVAPFSEQAVAIAGACAGWPRC